MVREVAAIIATGATPVIAAVLVDVTGSWIPVAVIIMFFFSACALFAAIWMKEVAGRDLTRPPPRHVRAAARATGGKGPGGRQPQHCCAHPHASSPYPTTTPELPGRSTR